MDNSFLVILSGVPLTIAVTLLAFAIGAVGGIPLVILRSMPIPILARATGLLIDWMRAVPPITWIFLIFYGVGSGVLQLTPLIAVILALGGLSSAYMAEIYRGGLLAIGKDQREASKALGLTPTNTFRFVLAPQAFRISIPAMVTYLIGLLKESSLAATIGVAEIAFHARTEAQITFDGLKIYGYAGLLYILLTLPMAWLARTANARMVAKVAR